ncbi:hypothetical protein BC567DRAFT_17434 [Phyllosticta citribraziliensis]
MGIDSGRVVWSTGRNCLHVVGAFHSAQPQLPNFLAVNTTSPHLDLTNSPCLNEKPQHGSPPTLQYSNQENPTARENHRAENHRVRALLLSLVWVALQPDEKSLQEVQQQETGDSDLWHVGKDDEEKRSDHLLSQPTRISHRHFLELWSFRAYFGRRSACGDAPAARGPLARHPQHMRFEAIIKGPTSSFSTLRIIRILDVRR